MHLCFLAHMPVWGRLRPGALHAVNDIKVIPSVPLRTSCRHCNRMALRRTPSASVRLDARMTHIMPSSGFALESKKPDF